MANINPNFASLKNTAKKYGFDDKFKLGNFSDFVTAETRAMLSKYSDPLTLNFKILINYDKPYGLFAPEETIDSALGFLKRSGQTVRYELLKNWIDIFKIVVKDFDFLLLSVENLEIIQNAKPADIFTEEDKISLTLRETSDMLIQSLIVNWRQIWYDDIRGVEVLPANLRRFDMSILLFSSGYYNMLFYDNNYGTDTIEKNIFPTVRKLDNKNFNINSASKFNHILYNLGDCTIDNDETGKPFVGSVLNEQNSDFIKNNITLNFRFANYSGLFNNISGNINYSTLLAITAATEQTSKVGEKIKKSLKEKLKEAGNNIKNSTIRTINQKIDNIDNMILSKNSVIGDLWSKMTVDYAEQMVKNTIDLGINKANDFLVVDPITKVNNLLYMNFGNNIYELIENNKKQKPNPKVKLINDEIPIKVYNKSNYIQKTVNVENGVKLGSSNIYSGNNL